MTVAGRNPRSYERSENEGGISLIVTGIIVFTVSILIMLFFYATCMTSGVPDFLSSTCDEYPIFVLPILVMIGASGIAITTSGLISRNK